MSFFFFQAEDGIRDRSPSRGLGDVYMRQCEKPAKLEGKNYMAVVAPKAATGGKKAKKDADKTAETK